MPITLNGSGTVSGISVGGLPDGCIQSADIASGVIPAGAKILQVKQTFLNTAVSINGVQSYTDIIHSDIPTIEKYGGGSARCMLTELF